MMDIILGNVKCHIHSINCGGPVVFWGMADRGDDSVNSVISYLEESKFSCTLFAFETENWNRDFSPWEMKCDDMYFEGCGSAVLKWIADFAVPYVKERYSNTDAYIIAGYSLSGLFALWAFYEMQIFKGVACCSASLWFEGWDEYAALAKAPVRSVVYLSLGGKEANSPNSVMASIGDKYKLQENRCKNDRNISKTVFEMNPGGHFSNTSKRIAKGIIRILKELQG